MPRGLVKLDLVNLERARPVSLILSVKTRGSCRSTRKGLEVIKSSRYHRVCRVSIARFVCIFATVVNRHRGQQEGDRYRFAVPRFRIRLIIATPGAE